MERALPLRAEQVLALCQDRLTEIRLPILPQPVGECFLPLPDGWGFDVVTERAGRPNRLHGTLRCPLGRPKDNLWVRETHAIYGEAQKQIEYRVSPLCGGDPDCGWRSPAQMPRWASRFLLQIREVGIERLQAIEESAAAQCGVSFTDFGEETPPGQASLDGGRRYHPLTPRQEPGWHLVEASGPDQCHATARGAFAGWWERRYGKDAPWAANPWIWVVSVTSTRVN